MTEEVTNAKANWHQRGRGVQGGGSSGGIYFMGFVGALIYFLRQATSFKGGALGFGKALVWPGLLVYKLAELLKL